MATDDTWSEAHYFIYYDCEDQRVISISGRDRRALEALIAASRKGCTPIGTSAPRWSGYVFNLCHLGVPIETVPDAHGGAFKGMHARYVLQAVVSPKVGATV